jgi:hypothetical protein
LGDSVWIIKSTKEASARISHIHGYARKRDLPVAWDFETNCLKPDGPKSKIYSCSLSLGENEPEGTVAFPWDARAQKAMAALLRDPKVRKIGANIKFEDRWCRRNGITVRGWWHDVVQVAHCIDNASKVRHVVPVDFQAVARLGVGDWDSGVSPYLRTEKGSGGYALNRVREVELTKLLRYNGLDSLYEWMVCAHQRNQLGMEM